MMRGLFLVAYDIADAKRLRRVFKLLKAYGVAVQYSVFECRLSSAQYKALYQALLAATDPVEDRIHIYPICQSCEAKTRVLGCGQRSQPLPVVWVISDG